MYLVIFLELILWAVHWFKNEFRYFETLVFHYILTREDFSVCSILPVFTYLFFLWLISLWPGFHGCIVSGPQASSLQSEAINTSGIFHLHEQWENGKTFSTNWQPLSFCTCDLLFSWFLSIFTIAHHVLLQAVLALVSHLASVPLTHSETLWAFTDNTSTWS